MRHPPHPGHVVQDLGFAEGTLPVIMAERLGLELAELRPALAAEASLTPQVALALEASGISNADFWMRVQAAYDLAQERLRREGAGIDPAPKDRTSGSATAAR